MLERRPIGSSGLLATAAETCRRYRLLEGAYIAVLCLMFLLGNIWASRTLFYVAVLPMGALLALPFAWRMLRMSVILWAAVAYFVVLGLSALGRPDTGAGLLLAHTRNSALILCFLVITAYLIWRSPRFLDDLFLAVSLSAAVNALANIVLFYADVSFTLGPHVRRLEGVIGISGYHNPNVLGAMYGIALVGAAGTLAGGRLAGLRRSAGLLAAAVLLLAVFLSQSRSSMVAVLAALLVLTLWRGGWRVKAAVLGGLAAIYAGIAAIAANPGFILSRGDSFRRELWGRYLAMAAERPWRGYGLGFDTTIRVSNGMEILNPHNIVLAAQIRGGAFAALALAAMLAAGFYWALRGWTRHRLIAPLGLIVAATVAGSLDFDIASTSLGWPWFLLWLPVGICVGTEAVLRLPEPHDAPDDVSAAAPVRAAQGSAARA